MKMQPTAGNRVYIREHLLTDRDAYVDWQCDPEVAEFLNWLPRTHEESCEGLREAIEQQKLEDRRHFFMAIVCKEDEEVVGDVGITLLNRSEADMGWFIRRTYWGRGYASEAVLLMTRWAFEMLGRKNIRASCSTQNTASVRIMEKAGFCLDERKGERLTYYLSYENWYAASVNEFK